MTYCWSSILDLEHDAPVAQCQHFISMQTVQQRLGNPGGTNTNEENMVQGIGCPPQMSSMAIAKRQDGVFMEAGWGTNRGGMGCQRRRDGAPAGAG